MTLPIKLPEGWSVRNISALNVIITTSDRAKYVAVDERLRAFEVGVMVVRKQCHVNYTGRNWRTRLYNDAVATLQAEI